jgi:putative chitinase
LAELMYGGRMGNNEPGDGYKYRGRGYIQLTGKENYEKAGAALGLDLVNHPDLAKEPKVASKIATWYWETRVPESARENVKAATKAVNGKYNGLEDRQDRFVEWEKVLTPEVMARLSKGEVGLPVTARSPSQHHAADGLLKPGEHGVEIVSIQKSLNKLGYHDAKGRVLSSDGDFGASTKEAVQAFQRVHGIKDDGIVGLKTLDALKKAEQAPLLSDPRHPDHGMFKEAVAGLEKLGTQAGFKNRQELEQAAGTMVFEAKASGLTQIDHVVPSTNGTGLFAVQGGLVDPAHHRIHVDKGQAGGQPIEQSTYQLQQEAQHRQALEQQSPQQQREPLRMAM